MSLKVETIQFDKLNGLVPAIIIDDNSLQVLMLGFMNAEAYTKTLESGLVTFFSRTRQQLWTKGATSGNFLHVRKIETDCDQDTLLIRVQPDGPVCHTGSTTCFGAGTEPAFAFLQKLYSVILERKFQLPEGSYTTSLFKRGSDRIIQKVGEEAVEVVIAAKNQDKKPLIEETADLLFHLLVLLADQDISPDTVLTTLMRRHGIK